MEQERQRFKTLTQRVEELEERLAKIDTVTSDLQREVSLLRNLFRRTLRALEAWKRNQ